MLANNYVGIVPPEVIPLIVRRARRFRINRDDLDDLQQQIVPVLAKFHFDPARANGATPVTAMTGVIDRQIKAYLRSKRRYQQRVERLQTMSDDSAGEIASTSSPDTESASVDLRLDLAQTLSGLSPRDREICQCLSQGLSIRAIAKQLGCSRETVDRALVRIRTVFDETGLRAWIDPNSVPAKQAPAGRAQ